jgi:hypothetical protein
MTSETTKQSAYADLRKLAEALKDSGDWESTDRTVYALEHHGWRKGEELFRNRFSFNVQRGPEFDDKSCVLVANFCAAANPAAILRLLNELDMARSLYEGAHADRMALAAVPAQPIADVSALRDAVAESLRGNYYCGRVWSAWNVGTMSEADFSPSEEVDECIDQVMDAVRPFLAPAADVSAPTDERAAFEAAWSTIREAGIDNGWLGVGWAAWQAARAAAPVSGQCAQEQATIPAKLTDAQIDSACDDIYLADYPSQREFERAIARAVLSAAMSLAAPAIPAHPAQPQAAAPVALTDAWISVDDRLPEVGVGVMVYSPPVAGEGPEDFRLDFDCIDPNDDHASWLNHNENYEHFCCVAKPEGSTGPKEKAPYTHWMPMPAAPGTASGEVAQLDEVVRFLMGEASLEGVHFGERHPTKAGMFWWRLNLRAAMSKAKG